MEDNTKDKDLHTEQNSAIDPESLVFHYNRSERISKAPRQVQSSYDGTMAKPPKGFFRALVHTKSSRIILIVMVLVLGFTVANLLMGDQKHKGKIDTIALNLSAFSFEDNIYVSLEIKPDAKTQGKLDSSFPENRLITAIFSFFDTDGVSVVEQKKELFFSNNEIFLRTTLSDYDILSVTCIVTVDEQAKLLETRVEKK